MSIITFKTPEDPIKLIIPEFLRLAKINAELIKIASLDELQDIKIEYFLWGEKTKTKVEGKLDQSRFARYASIETAWNFDLFFPLYDKLKSQGYTFNNDEIFLSVSFQNGYTGDWNILIDITKDSTTLHTTSYRGYANVYSFDRDAYIQELEKRGLERIIEPVPA